MTGCPNELAIARALTVGTDAELEEHLEACETCRTSWEAQVATIELARELPVALPPAARREEVRTAILASTTRADKPRSLRTARLAFGGVAVIAAAMLGFVMLPTGDALQPHGTIHAAADAAYSVTDPPDEQVRLTEGRLDIEVSPLEPGERYRVVVGDAEIEVRGTAFAVIARADHLISVEVRHGRVEVRPSTAAPSILVAGERWQAPSPVTRVETPPVVTPAPPVVAPSIPVAPAAPAPSRSTDRPSAPREVRATAPVERTDSAPPPRVKPVAELAYDEAWTAMRARQFGTAAKGFARSLALAPTGPISEDAAYWHAVALARANRHAEAVGAFRDFLAEHPSSPHAGEASTMLGWLLVDDRAFDEAARRFRRALDDPDPTVRGSARSGLDALHR